MGVSGLLGLLKSIQKPCHLKDFHGQTIGIDAYGWLHRGAVNSAVDLALGKPNRSYVDFAMHRVRMLIHFGITPYLVFDGDHLPSKAETETARADRRSKSKASGLELLKTGQTSLAHQQLQKAVDITPEMARHLIEELKRHAIKYVVAPYEADAQLAYLEQKGHIQAILSEDSDLLIFGAKCLLTKLDQYGECVMLRQADFTSCREVSLVGWSYHDLRRMAILSGCDYLEGVPRMGLKTAHRLVRKYKTIERIMRGAQLDGKFRFPDAYEEKFTRAELTFLYQWVYCPDGSALVNLTVPSPKDQLQGVTCIGAYVEPEVARRISRGDLNPMTKEEIVLDRSMSSFYRTPAIPRKGILTKSVSADMGNHRPIDNFFKPKRVPLAELDPNSFTPSPSQQRLLQSETRTWPTNIAPPQFGSNAPGSRLTARRTTHVPGPTPIKRRRLCTDDGDAQSSLDSSIRSKFFSSSCPEPLRSKCQAAKVDVYWDSDESLENVMAKLPESSTLPDVRDLPDVPSPPGVELVATPSLAQPKPPERSVVSVLRDSTGSLRTPSPSNHPASRFTKPKDAADCLSDRQSSAPSEMRNWALSDKFTFAPYTNPRERQNQATEASSIDLTPLQTVTSNGESSRQEPAALREARPLRGSEDILLVPESETESNAAQSPGSALEERVVASSPMRRQEARDGTLEDGSLEDGTLEDDTLGDGTLGDGTDLERDFACVEGVLQAHGDGELSDELSRAPSPIDFWKRFSYTAAATR